MAVTKYSSLESEIAGVIFNTTEEGLQSSFFAVCKIIIQIQGGPEQ